MTDAKFKPMKISSRKVLEKAVDASAKELEPGAVVVFPTSSEMQRIADYIEQHYHVSGQIPEQTLISQRAAVLLTKVNGFFNSSRAEKMLAQRGIYLTEVPDLLPAEQLAMAIALYNPDDTRSRAKKLSDAGITAVQWNAWMMDPAFRQYVHQIGEQQLAAAQSDAHMALIRKVRQGDMKAIPYYNQMTGRFDATLKAQVNVALLFQQMLDILQRHVTDPAVMRSIADDLNSLAVKYAGGTQ